DPALYVEPAENQVISTESSNFVSVASSKPFRIATRQATPMQQFSFVPSFLIISNALWPCSNSPESRASAHRATRTTLTISCPSIYQVVHLLKLTLVFRFLCPARKS